MKQHFSSGFHADLSPEEEEEMRQHVLEILQEADSPDDGLSIGEIYERLLYRETKQKVDSMVRDGLMVHFECCRTYASSRMVRNGLVCRCNALNKEE